MSLTTHQINQEKAFQLIHHYLRTGNLSRVQELMTNRDLQAHPGFQRALFILQEMPHFWLTYTQTSQTYDQAEEARIAAAAAAAAYNRDEDTATTTATHSPASLAQAVPAQAAQRFPSFVPLAPAVTPSFRRPSVAAAPQDPFPLFAPLRDPASAPAYPPAAAAAATPQSRAREPEGLLSPPPSPAHGPMQLPGQLSSRQREGSHAPSAERPRPMSLRQHAPAAAAALPVVQRANLLEETAPERDEKTQLIRHFFPRVELTFKSLNRAQQKFQNLLSIVNPERFALYKNPEAKNLNEALENVCALMSILGNVQATYIPKKKRCFLRCLGDSEEHLRAYALYRDFKVSYDRLPHERKDALTQVFHVVVNGINIL